VCYLINRAQGARTRFALPAGGQSTYSLALFYFPQIQVFHDDVGRQDAIIGGKGFDLLRYDPRANAAVPPVDVKEDANMIAQEVAYNSLGARLYSVGQVSLACFLGGPLGGALLLRHNFRALNDDDAARMAVWWAAAATVLLGACVNFLPDNFPNHFLPACCTAAVCWIAERTQGKAYKAHISAGGLQNSWWRAVGIGGVSLVITLVVLFVVLFAIAMVMP
jgi:hypothetical protein